MWHTRPFIEENAVGRKRKIDVVPGMVFGSLTATAVPYRLEEKENRLFCTFKCVCGNEKPIRLSHVVNGLQKSCGCVRPNRLEKGEASFNSLFGSYKYHADARGIPFGISKEDLRVLTKRDCAYCGAEPNREHVNFWRKGSKSSPYVCNGIDRSDNTLGYTKENCVPCCKICNIAKHSMSLEEFLAWLDRLVKFRTTVKETLRASE
jgi:hypothetical protein